MDLDQLTELVDLVGLGEVLMALGQDGVGEGRDAEGEEGKEGGLHFWTSARRGA